MNTASPHLPQAAPLGASHRRHRTWPVASRIRPDLRRAAGVLRRRDDLPGVEPSASPSDLALRSITDVHSLHR